MWLSVRKEIHMEKNLKKVGALVLLIALMFSFPGRASAGTIVEKLSRSATNIITAPLEFFRQPYALHRKYEISGMAAFFGGIFTGIYATVVRELAGIYEFITFPFPLPSEYRSIIDPPTVFDGGKYPEDYKH